MWKFYWTEDDSAETIEAQLGYGGVWAQIHTVKNDWEDRQAGMDRTGLGCERKRSVPSPQSLHWESWLRTIHTESTQRYPMWGREWDSALGDRQWVNQAMSPLKPGVGPHSPPTLSISSWKPISPHSIRDPNDLFSLLMKQWALIHHVNLFGL